MKNDPRRFDFQLSTGLGEGVKEWRSVFNLTFWLKMTFKNRKMAPDFFLLGKVCLQLCLKTWFAKVSRRETLFSGGKRPFKVSDFFEKWPDSSSSPTKTSRPPPRRRRRRRRRLSSSTMIIIDDDHHR